MENCIFCKIINKTLPANLVFENDNLMAFDDIHPKAPTHILLIPKLHIPTLSDLTTDNDKLIAEMIHVANQIAKDKNISENGYRVVVNIRNHGGQEVDHLHLHIMGGQPLKSLG